ncbi:axonemal dynein light chain domain-containing protein 1-like [Podarcis raffonei]|uniref:axonemal dynein light chain domain-containing protein 1-like n=1 Tax=Podarcis raffonei TaxID=65483 RepID=UPI00232914D5|nr:axonemal dynein light chain domain-containing protein 1-like [Podarcis raffonei]
MLQNLKFTEWWGRQETVVGPKNGHCQGCIRTTDGVWQHPVRRNKFRYLIEHPICLTGAGRDVSFLYDLAAEKEAKNPPPTPVSHKTSTNLQQQEPTAAKLPTGIADSLVPEEFHILKNRGVLRLEYYDDKYTTLLEDDENRLRVFPSMKPSGRLEVLQLMKVMDTMLERAGTNKDVGVTGVSQVNNSCQEIIYWSTTWNLYREMMAQRVMDKHITDELFHFKEAIGKLTRELNTIREHDRRVTVEAEKAYEELAKAVQDSEMNANLLDEYRELYELQRRRLEAQIHQLTQEKELWSNATYELALKGIEKNKLTLARRMYDSEKAWVKGMRHFIMMLASQEELLKRSARILTSLINSLEDWSFKLLANKQKGSMHETEWIKFFQTVSEWIAQIDDLLSFIGSGDTVEDHVQRKEKERDETGFLILKWHCCDVTYCCGYSDIMYFLSCCKEMVATITRQKMVTLQPDAEHELQQLERIKTECLDWIETCNLLLSGMKTTPTTLISPEDLVGLFGLEVLQLKRQLPPRPEQRVEISSTTDVPVEEEKKDKEAVDVLKDQEAAEQKQALEAEERPPVPSTSTGEQAESLAVTYPVRYIGDDSNVYVKTMQVQEITVSRRELHASQWTTKASKKEFELLASLEILEERLVEAEKRAQQAEEKSEVLHEDLEEALAKIQNMEGEQPKLKDSEQKETKLKAEVVVKEQTESPSQSSTPKPRTKKFPKPKR